MCVLVFSARRNTLRVVEIIPRTTRAIPSANNQCKFALLTQLSTHAHTVGTNDNGCGDARFGVQTTQLLLLEVPAAGTADTESGLKYRLSPRHPSPLLSPLQLESSPLFSSRHEFELCIAASGNVVQFCAFLPNGHLHDIGGELMLTDPPDAFRAVLMSVNMIRIGLWQFAHLQSPRGYLTLVEWLKITRDHCTLTVLSDSIVKEVQVDFLNVV